MALNAEPLSNGVVIPPSDPGSGPTAPGAGELRGRSEMANRTYVVNEVVGTSDEDVNTAIRNGLKRASQTLRNLDWFEVIEVRGAIVNGDVAHYQVTMKVGFRLEDREDSQSL
jgi:flavin-binding protein dodecin